MTEEEYRTTKAFIKQYTSIHTRTKEAALQAMIREGIYTPDGFLRPEFGGPIDKEKTIMKKEIKVTTKVTPAKPVKVEISKGAIPNKRFPEAPKGGDIGKLVKKKPF